MKFIKIFLTSLCLIITTVANADVASQALNKVSEKISEYKLVLFLERELQNSIFNCQIKIIMNQELISCY